MIPQGKLIIIGGHEDKGDVPGEGLAMPQIKRPRENFEILGTLMADIPRAHHSIEIIASASAIPEEMEALYINSYKQVGFTHVGFVRVENEADAHDPAAIKRIHEAHAVFFTGGDQLKLMARLGGTAALAAVSKKYYADKNFIVAGTSAGAMVMPEVIITGGAIESALYKGDIDIAKGFGLLKDVIVDTHFIKRGRFARLAHAVTLNTSCLGIGLEENTALVISGGEYAECIGSGMVILIDGSKIRATNVATAEGTVPVVVENLIVSIIAEGSRYSLKERKFVV